MKLSGKSALIVGGGDAIGRGIALRFAKDGARIAIVDADGDAARETAAALSAHGDAPVIVATIDGPDQARQVVDRAVAAIGKVDVLVNNVLGIGPMGPLEEKTQAVVDRGLQDAKAALWMMQAVFPGMRERRWGRIINVGSRYGERMNVYNAEYNMAAWALRALTRSAAAEWFNHNIITNLLETAADTPDFQAYRAHDPQTVDWLVEQTALGRRGDPEEDIGGVASIMACDEVDWINGQIFYADGGQHLAAPAYIPAVPDGFFVKAQEGIYEYE